MYRSLILYLTVLAVQAAAISFSANPAVQQFR